MTKKRGLGKGLEALIPVSAGERPAGLIEVSVDDIAPNPLQPRQKLDPDSLAELAASIREHGLIQPLIVSSTVPGTADAPYQLIAGERRLEAARLAGLSTVPVIVKEATPQQMLALALVENIQRADLNPLEEASAYRQLMDEFGMTQEQVAEQVGKSRVAVANTVRLLRLPAAVKSALADGQISEGHARALLGLDHEEAQLRALKTVVKQQLNVRQTEELVRRMLAGPPPHPERTTSPETEALERRFRERLGTKVRLFRSKRGGKLVIHFYSEEELQAIYDVIVGGS
ncbi:MAG: ParB/RepB/Spo0J family partition protein [Anaerolineae bacterium]|nr:ParB/RepB/Spo0J family partition protein [Anaerolineae bacterium]MDH7474277.1 ParB/RepB/Spo0J family partition protein [Anaerolineae bacterium]